MRNPERKKFDSRFIEWVDSRLPIFTLMRREYLTFQVPKNLNFMWTFGAIATVMLFIMIISGLALAMHYVPDVDHAFNSVEHIMRDVNYGWLIRYMHSNGASFFFIATYFHIYRSMYYGSYKKPREMVWIMGMVLFLLMMMTAFTGYVLPFGQMGYWGATVITGLFSTVPYIGEDLALWIKGSYTIDNVVLTRFYMIHFLIPFVIVLFLGLHIWALHITGSNNPSGIEPKSKKDTVSFHPYYTSKDALALVLFFVVYAGFTFFAPNALGHPDNYVPANPMVTPEHVVPEWYFLPFYAILKSITFDLFIPFTDIVLIDVAFGGALAMFASIFILFLLPFLDWHPVRSARYRPLFRIFFLLLVIDVFVLGFVGASPALGMSVLIGQAATAYYFAFFVVILPLLSLYEPVKNLPETLSDTLSEA